LQSENRIKKQKNKKVVVVDTFSNKASE